MKALKLNEKKSYIKIHEICLFQDFHKIFLDCLFNLKMFV